MTMDRRTLAAFRRPQRPHHRLRQPAAVFSTLALATASIFIVPAPDALAGPDFGKYLATRTHVDIAPHFDNGETGVTVAGHAGENSVIWVPNDKDESTENNHLYTVPEGDEWRWLGEPGQILWTAPQDVGTDQLPIYLGYERINDDYSFKDGNYALDLVEVDGPGDVEVFTQTFSGLRRVFSSTDSRYRSYIQPRHSHMYTTFSKPGRYVLTYRTAARSDDTGEPVPANEVKVAYQVGGEWPEAPYENQLEIADMHQAFAKAPEFSGKTSPKLTLQPHSETTPSGDATGTDITFDTGNKADNGTLFLTLNGYHFLEYPVYDGKASTWDTLGDGDADFQAVFIPKEGSPTGRWASEQFSYNRTTAGITEAASPTDKLAGEAPGPKRISGWDSQSLTYPETSVEVTATPDKSKPHLYHFEVTPQADNMMGVVQLKFKESVSDPAPSCSEEVFLNGDSATFDMDLDGCENYFLGIDFTPHPYSNLPVSQSKPKKIDAAAGIKETIQLSTSGNTTIGTDADVPGKSDGTTEPEDAETDADASEAESPDKVPEAPAAPKITKAPESSEKPTASSPPASSTSTKPSASSGTTSAKPSSTSTSSAAVGKEEPSASENGKQPDGTQKIQDKLGLIKSGHADIRVIPTTGDDHIMGVAHDSTTSKPGEPDLYRLRKTAFMVPKNAKQVREGKLEDPQYDVLGEVGGEFYTLPEVQNQSLPWPGFSTENLDYSRYGGEVTYTFSMPKAPEGGRLAFSNQKLKDGGFKLESIIDSANPSKMVLPTSTRMHMHGSWTFTKPGVYTLCVGATSKGETLAKMEPLRFIVGEENPMQVLKDEAAQDVDCSDKPMPEGSGQDGQIPDKASIFDKFLEDLFGGDETAAPEQKDPSTADSEAIAGSTNENGKHTHPDKGGMTEHSHGTDGDQAPQIGKTQSSMKQPGHKHSSGNEPAQKAQPGKENTAKGSQSHSSTAKSSTNQAKSSKENSGDNSTKAFGTTKATKANSASSESKKSGESKSSSTKSSEAKSAGGSGDSGSGGFGKGGSTAGGSAKGGPLATTGEDAAVMGWLITGAIAAAGGAMLVFGIRRSQGSGS